MSSASRKLLIESGELDWITINPDIFGSMMLLIQKMKEKNLECIILQFQIF